MIITESFVWINYPKTASTFVRTSLRSIYATSRYNILRRLRLRGRWMQEVMLPEKRAWVGDRYGAPTPHGTLQQIPLEHRSKPVVSAMRHPVSRCLSLYNYGDWQIEDQLPRSSAEIKSRWPAFPNLDFETFVEYGILEGSATLNVGGQIYSLGPQSSDFLAFFTPSRNHEQRGFVFGTWRDLERALAEITFLVSDDINNQLFSLLVRFGFNRAHVKHIVTLHRINESKELVSASLINEKTRKRIESCEWLLFEWWKKISNGVCCNLETIAIRHRR